MKKFGMFHNIDVDKIKNLPDLQAVGWSVYDDGIEPIQAVISEA